MAIKGKNNWKIVLFFCLKIKFLFFLPEFPSCIFRVLASSQGAPCEGPLLQFFCLDLRLVALLFLCVCWGRRNFRRLKKKLHIWFNLINSCKKKREKIIGKLFYFFI